MSFTAQLNTLLRSYLSYAVEMFGPDKAANLNIKDYQRLMVLLAECIDSQHLIDKSISRHAVEQLDQSGKPEQAVMHCFVLYIYKLCRDSSKHPLEEGIIKQKIINILPMFESALKQGQIAVNEYDKNADALAHIADQTEEVPALLSAIALEYERLC